MAVVGTTSGQGIQVTGLREWQTAIRQVDRELPKEVRKEFLSIADYVVGQAQQRMPWGSGEAMRSLKARATQKGAGISRPAGGTPWRGEKADYYPWLDFGGSVGRGRIANGHQAGGGSIHRPVVKGGRYLYPAIVGATDYIVQHVGDTILRVARTAGFEVRG